MRYTPHDRARHPERERLLRERTHHLHVCAALRHLRLHLAREYLPNGAGVRRQILRAPQLAPPHDEVPTSVILELIEELGVREAVAEQRARVLAERLGLDKS